MKEFFRHFLIPQHTNNHRAKALHFDVMILYMIVFMVFTFTMRTLHKSMPDILGYATDIYVDQLLASTNAKRQESGLGALNLNENLSQAASAKAQDMFAKNYWSHNSPDGSSPWVFILNSGYQYTVAGENLAKNFYDSGSVVNAWMDSPTHRDNILKSTYQDVGYAVVNGVLNGEEVTLVVQMFGARSGSSQQVVKPVYAQDGNTETETPPLAVKEEILPTPTAVPVEVPSDAKARDVTVLASEPEASNQLDQVGTSSVLISNAGVSVNPKYDINTITRVMVYGFIGIMMLVLLVDAVVISRKKIVRVSGHTVSHILFLSTLLLALSFIMQGSIL
jgi:uncharacterized protein YkwD